MAAMVDPAADIFIETDRRLREWGTACRSNSERLGLPASSGIARMIEVVSVFEQRRHRVGKKKKARVVALPTGRAKICSGCELVYAADECPRCGPRPTARGSQTKSFKPITSIDLSSSVTVTDAVIASLPGWAKKIIMRAYLWSEPDRISAYELGIPKQVYRLHREAAVEMVAERIASRAGAAI